MPDNDTGLYRRAGVLMFSASFLMLFASSGMGQVANKSNPDQTINLNVSQTDTLAAGFATSSGAKHILTPSAGVGVRVSRSEIAKNGGGSTTSSNDAATSSSDDSDEETVPSPGYYTSDISNPKGGPVITDMVGHPIYVNTTPETVGHPGRLLRDLGESELVHVVDQYVGTQADDRYKAGAGGAITTTPISGPLYNADIVAFVHAAASYFGDTGYHAEYHVFTGPGQDICIANTASPVCYSPDNKSTFSFCAYHGSIVFSDIGEVIYSVEPYENVPGCRVGAPSPNGLVIDSTMSVLSHEFFESITDPDGDAWWDHYGLDLRGAEIGDICQNATFVYPVVKLNHTKYELQAEYSNKYHACAYVP